jgi:hypothetical protein
MIDLVLFSMLLGMACTGYAGAYYYMIKHIRVRDIEISILHMYIEKELDNDERRTVGI